VEGNDVAVAARTRDLFNATIVRSRQMVYEARHNLAAVRARGVFAIVVEYGDWRSACHTTNTLSRTAAFVLADIISHDFTTLAAESKRKEFARHILFLGDEMCWDARSLLRIVPMRHGEFVLCGFDDAFDGCECGHNLLGSSASK
jgi:hypothetical protein